MNTEAVSIWDNFEKMDEMDEKSWKILVGSYDTCLVVSCHEVIRKNTVHKVQKFRGLIVF